MLFLDTLCRALGAAGQLAACGQTYLDRLIGTELLRIMPWYM